MKTLYLSEPCPFKAHCKLHRLSFTWLDAMVDASEKFVLASESNLSLATRLAS